MRVIFDCKLGQHRRDFFDTFSPSSSVISSVFLDKRLLAYCIYVATTRLLGFFHKLPFPISQLQCFQNATSMRIRRMHFFQREFARFIKPTRTFEVCISSFTIRVIIILSIFSVLLNYSKKKMLFFVIFNPVTNGLSFFLNDVKIIDDKSPFENWLNL